MLQAFETFEMDLHPERILPTALGGPWGDHVNQSEVSISIMSHLLLSLLDGTGIRDI